MFAEDETMRKQNMVSIASLYSTFWMTSIRQGWSIDGHYPIKIWIWPSKNGTCSFFWRCAMLFCNCRLKWNGGKIKNFLNKRNFSIVTLLALTHAPFQIYPAVLVSDHKSWSLDSDCRSFYESCPKTYAFTFWKYWI